MPQPTIDDSPALACNRPFEIVLMLRTKVVAHPGHQPCDGPLTERCAWCLIELLTNLFGNWLGDDRVCSFQRYQVKEIAAALRPKVKQHEERACSGPICYWCATCLVDRLVCLADHA